MSTTSALRGSLPAARQLGMRGVTAIALLIIALATAAFVVGRVTASTQASTSIVPAHVSTSLAPAQNCRTGVPC